MLSLKTQYQIKLYQIAKPDGESETFSTFRTGTWIVVDFLIKRRGTLSYNKSSGQFCWWLVLGIKIVKNTNVAKLLNFNWNCCLPHIIVNPGSCLHLANYRMTWFSDHCIVIRKYDWLKDW